MPAADSIPLSPRAALVHRLAASLGFALVGIAPALPSERAAELRAWLDAGKHGEMDYLARYANVAIDPQKVLPGAKAIICVADRYAERGESSEFRVANSELLQEQEDRIDTDCVSSTRISELETRNFPIPSGRIARYAQGDDYHRVMKNRLHELADALREQFPEHLFRTTVDTAPVMEREHAARAGLGWVGKHTLLIHPQIGSYFLLGEILTTLPLETSADAGFPPPTVAPLDHCGSCTRCIDACPTQCITPYSVDASRCISYLTIEHRSEIDATLHPMMRDWLAGCDVCQQVCPYNAEKPEIGNSKAEISTSTGTVPASYTPRLPALPLLEVLNWTEDSRQATLIRSPLKRIKLDMFKRNALIAAGNFLAEHDAPDLRTRIESLAHDPAESDLVRNTAKQVLSR